MLQEDSYCTLFQVRLINSAWVKNKKPLTAVIVSGGELGALVPTARAVAGLHLQLVPGGLPQLRQEHVRRGVGPHRLPRPRAWTEENAVHRTSLTNLVNKPR